MAGFFKSISRNRIRNYGIYYLRFRNRLNFLFFNWRSIKWIIFWSREQRCFFFSSRGKNFRQKALSFFNFFWFYYNLCLFLFHFYLISRNRFRNFFSLFGYRFLWCFFLLRLFISFIFLTDLLFFSL